MQRNRSMARTILQPLAAAVLLALLLRLVVHVYEIPSDSMLPTLRPGDRILVVRYFNHGPDRGDVVVFESPAGNGELLVKRVIGLPGDLVDSRMGRLRVGGYTVPEPYLLQQAATGEIETQVVPSDSYFVLGDNREVSIDSRSRGPIPAGAVVGHAQLILWSSTNASANDGHSRDAGGIRLFKCIE